MFRCQDRILIPYLCPCGLGDFAYKKLLKQSVLKYPKISTYDVIPRSLPNRMSFPNMILKFTKSSINRTHKIPSHLIVKMCCTFSFLIIKFIGALVLSVVQGAGVSHLRNFFLTTHAWHFDSSPLLICRISRFWVVFGKIS